MADVPAGLPPDVRDALAGRPPRETQLLELALAWPGLTDARARVAARLRVFVLSDDPLRWTERFEHSWASANGDGDDYEVVLLPLRQRAQVQALLRRVTGRGVKWMQFQRLWHRKCVHLHVRGPSHWS